VTISGLVTDIGGFLVRACAGGSRYATACAFTLLAGLQPRTADQDHRLDHAAGGLTDEDNLEPKCRHDHRLKHEAGWQVERTEPGVTVWTSALGHRHESRPPPIIDRLPVPVPDHDGERFSPDGWYVWQSRSAACDCDDSCDCEPPILPPVPRRVPKVQPGELERQDVQIFDPDDEPPF